MNLAVITLIATLSSINTANNKVTADRIVAVVEKDIVTARELITEATKLRLLDEQVLTDPLELAVTTHKTVLTTLLEQKIGDMLISIEAKRSKMADISETEVQVDSRIVHSQNQK